VVAVVVEWSTEPMPVEQAVVLVDSEVVFLEKTLVEEVAQKVD